VTKSTVEVPVLSRLLVGAASGRTERFSEARSGGATSLSNLVTEFGNSPTKINDLLLLRTEAP
jgi:hypothetical protein